MEQLCIYCSGLLMDRCFLTPLWLVRVTPKRVLQPSGIAILEKWKKLALGCDKNLPLSGFNAFISKSLTVGVSD